MPLLLAGPGVPAGRTVECLVRTVDVAPTLLGLAGVAAPPRAGMPPFDGRSLLPLPAAGAGCDRESYSESFLPFFAYKWYPLRSLAGNRFFYLQAPHPSLFQLASDPGEITDLARAVGVGERLDTFFGDGAPIADERLDLLHLRVPDQGRNRRQPQWARPQLHQLFAHGAKCVGQPRRP